MATQEKRTTSSGNKKGSPTNSSARSAKAAKASASGKASGGNGKTAAKRSGASVGSNGNDRKGTLASVIDSVAKLFQPGEPDAIELLKADHRVVDSLFEKVRANEDGNNKPTFKKIKSELDVHARIEEEIFYPYLLKRGDKELKKIVREGIEEHRQAKMFLSEMESLTGTSEQFKAKMQVLMEDIDHHVKEEEDEMFKMVRDQIGEKTLLRLAEEMKAAKARLKKNVAGRSASSKAPARKARAAA
jgi:iron-sulfur cluster repair protein YtfE (RIC family)